MNRSIIEDRLNVIAGELQAQPDVGRTFPENMKTFDEDMSEILSNINDAGEYGIAYEEIVCLLEAFPFTLSGKSAVYLLEVGLIFGFKTERAEDEQFDRR